MKKMSERIIEKDIVNFDDHKIRTTVRGVIINQHKEVLLLYSKKYDDYTFPGGGVKQNETHESALRRELKEEIGAIDISIIKPIGYLEEFRYGIHGDESVYLQTSYYYLVRVDDYQTPSLIDREKVQGLLANHLDMDKAIKHNEHVMHDVTHQTKGLKTVLPRENQVLKYLKEHLHEIL